MKLLAETDVKMKSVRVDPTELFGKSSNKDTMLQWWRREGERGTR